MNTRKITAIVVAAIIGIFLSTSVSKLAEDVDAGEIVVIQDPIDGELHVYSSPGWVPQNFGTATHYKRSFQFWFSKTKESEGSQPIPVKFNDGGHGTISGSTRVNLPTDELSMKKLHSDFRSQEAIESALIRTTLEKAVYMTGPLMSSKESYAEKRNDLLSYIEDQALNGVYKTIQKDVKIKDELSNTEKTVMQVEIVQKSGVSLRNEVSPLKTYNIAIVALSINAVDYDKVVEAQIAAQQQAYMQVQTAIANSRRAEQDAITAEQQGKAGAAKAKWDQEILKAKAITAGEQELAVQELATKTAELYKKQQILEGEGDAERKRLSMAANGALEQKLAALQNINKYWADAFAKYTGNVTPMWQNGSGGTVNGFANQMDFMNLKAMQDLSMSLKTK